MAMMRSRRFIRAWTSPNSTDPGAMHRLNRLLGLIPPLAIYLFAAILGFGLLALGLLNRLGADPVDYLIDQYGLLALQFLIASLAITPLRTLGINLMRLRRALGLVAFFMALAHLLSWLWFDRGWVMAEILREIIKRPFITLGMIAFLTALPLALTSNNLAIKRMGAMRWRKLHRLTYLLALLVPVHYLMVVKGTPPEPFIYFGGVLLLLGFRLARFWHKADKASKRNP